MLTCHICHFVTHSCILPSIVVEMGSTPALQWGSLRIKMYTRHWYPKFHMIFLSPSSKFLELFLTLGHNCFSILSNSLFTCNHFIQNHVILATQVQIVVPVHVVKVLWGIGGVAPFTWPDHWWRWVVNITFEWEVGWLLVVVWAFCRRGKSFTCARNQTMNPSISL